MKAGKHQPSIPMVDTRAAMRVVSLATDVALVLDDKGTVLEVSLGEGVEAHPGWNDLVGQRWAETVTAECRHKTEQLVADARDGRPGRSREINQMVEGVGEVAMRFNATRFDDGPRVMALGRDLRPMVSLQQRLISSQQAMEREYGRLRQADMRYRVLFHVSAESVLVAQGNGRVVEANPAAAVMFGESTKALQGRDLVEFFHVDDRAAVRALLAAIDGGARPVDLRVTLHGHQDRAVTLSASVFRQSDAALVLLRLSPEGAVVTAAGERTARSLAVLEAMPDGFVVIGEDRRILSANAAFCEIVQRASENHVVGEPLDRWLGRPGVDLNIMLTALREHGTLRNFATVVRGEFGPSQEGLVTAVSALNGKLPCIGFTIRTVSSRLGVAPSTPIMPRSVEQLRELVGRVSLKELVRESADLIERLCIEAALDVSGNNRASAAQLLGLSRQGLYSKLRRHGLAEFDPS